MKSLRQFSLQLKPEKLKLVPEATEDEQFDALCQQLLLEMDQYFVVLKYGVYLGGQRT